MLYRNYICLSILSFCTFIFSTNAVANRDGEVTQMSLLIQNTDVFLSYPSSVDRTSVSSVQVTWWQTFSESIEARLSIASIELRQKSNSSVLMYDATGYALGLGMRGNVFESELVNAGLSFSFDYMSVTGETNLSEAMEVFWYETSLSADFEFLPTSAISILAGGSYSVIDGEHEVLDTASVVSFSEDNPVGYYAGLAFKSGQSGSVTVLWQGGYRQGVYLSFSSQF